MRHRILLAVAAAALAGASLAGCGGSGGTALPIACPQPGILADGADLTRYRPGPVQDLTTLEFDARIDRRGSCRPGRGDRSIEVQVVAKFDVERGVGAAGRVVELPWFVAVVDERTGQVLSRQSFVDRIAFGRSETRGSGESEPVAVSLPVGEDRRASDYRIYLSFELTAEDLALNRRRGPR